MLGWILLAIYAVGVGGIAILAWLTVNIWESNKYEYTPMRWWEYIVIGLLWPLWAILTIIDKLSKRQSTSE